MKSYTDTFLNNYSQQSTAAVIMLYVAAHRSHSKT